ncbi:hypothetical protein BGZ47_007389, partial [Haplosporangium gracile]
TTDAPWAHNRSVSQQSTRLEVELDFTPAPSPTVSQPGSRPGSRGAGSYFQSLDVVEPGNVAGSGPGGGESPLTGSRETFSSSPGPLSVEEDGGSSNSSSLVVAQTNGGRENSLPKVKNPAARAILNSRKSSRGGAGGSSSPRSVTPQLTKKPVVIHQSLSTLSQPGQTGTVVWDSSILMSKFLLSIKGLSTRCYRTEEGRRLRKEIRENRRRRERERRQREQVRRLEERADRLAITANGELVDSDEGPIIKVPHDIDSQDDGDDDDDDLDFDDEDGNDDDNREEEKEEKLVLDPAETTILELGSGCGLLGIVMAELCQDLLLTDQKPVLPLLVKNLRKNLDKKYFGQDLLNGSSNNNGPITSRKKDRSSATAATGTSGATDVRPCYIQVQELVWGQDLDQELKRGMGVDFVVATDVVYNESIVPKLVQTLQELCQIREGVREEIRQGQGEHLDQLQEQALARPGQRMRRMEKTVVLLAQELRTDFVHLAFLEGLEQAGFRMVRIPREMMDSDYQSGYVIYAFFLR